MPASRGHNLQISFGKTRNTATCMHGLMTSYAAKDHVTPRGGKVGVAFNVCLLAGAEKASNYLPDFFAPTSRRKLRETPTIL